MIFRRQTKPKCWPNCKWNLKGRNQTIVFLAFKKKKKSVPISQLNCITYLVSLKGLSIMCVTLYFNVMEMTSFLKPHEQLPASFKFLQFPHFIELRRFRAFSGLGFSLRKGCGWFNLLFKLLNFLCISSKAVLLFYHLCVNWSNTFHFL